MTEGQAPIHYSEKLQTAEQAGRLIQQDIRSGTGQLFFPAESPHRAGTGYAGVVGGMDIHIRVPDIDRRLRTRRLRFECLKKGGRIRFVPPARPASADRGERPLRENVFQDLDSLFLRLVGYHDEAAPLSGQDGQQLRNARIGLGTGQAVPIVYTQKIGEEPADQGRIRRPRRPLDQTPGAVADNLPVLL